MLPIEMFIIIIGLNFILIGHVIVKGLRYFKIVIVQMNFGIIKRRVRESFKKIFWERLLFAHPTHIMRRGIHMVGHFWILIKWLQKNQIQTIKYILFDTGLQLNIECIYWGRLLLRMRSFSAVRMGLQWNVPKQLSIVWGILSLRLLHCMQEYYRAIFRKNWVIAFRRGYFRLMVYIATIYPIY